MAANIQDDGFREIQLSGKQLIFLFMAVTLAGVVVFLTGVMVGRDVRGERARLAQTAAVAEAPAPDVVSISPTPPPQTVVATVDPRTPPPDPVDDPNEKAAAVAAPPAEKAAAPAAKPAPPATKPAPPAAKPAPAPAEAKNAAVTATPTKSSGTSSAADAIASGAPGSGFQVQVAALNVRSEADAIAKRLNAKGYAAYVQTPNGATSVFRVRVGSFKTRREAESVAARLQKEEQYKPWVTR